VSEALLTETAAPVNRARFERVRYAVEEPGIARITLARPQQRNAQDYQMLYELDEAFGMAASDDAVQVTILCAEGPHFSSGHDLVDAGCVREVSVVGTGGYDMPGQHGPMVIEEELYLGMCLRWRNHPKPTIAQVQGKVIAGGLMLVWPCDLIIASEDATFSDPTVAFGVNGHEYFTHAWELGSRKAKEVLFRGSSLTASQCEQLGMVNHVVPREELEAFTLGIAREIAARPPMGLKLAKLAVNQSLEAQGQLTAIHAAFGLHQLGHANARIVHGIPVDPTGIAVIRELSR
jgi:enoyl-CoA hydratase